MANTNHIPRAHLIGIATLAIFSAIVADYMWFKLSTLPPKTFALPVSDVMDEISSIASNRWNLKRG